MPGLLSKSDCAKCQKLSKRVNGWEGGLLKEWTDCFLVERMQQQAGKITINLIHYQLNIYLLSTLVSITIIIV